MFTLWREAEVGPGLSRRAMVLSFVLHTAIVAYFCWQPEPPLINRTAVMTGENGQSIGLVYLPTDSSFRIPVNEESHSLKYTAAVKRPLKRHHVAAHQTDEHPTDAKVQSPALGSPNGDSSVGRIYGIGAFPALPVKFPDPHVSASELPPGVAGDVVIEVTIDVAGNIVAKKVLQSIGYGIDEKVLAVLENWRFRPASVNGMPVASRQDVHFHFPS
ncbi:MAG TPA: energy transducer TonB [Terriglobales bacterium]|nr:energy transducer TonB [Terriglobales bacterium]